MEECYLVITRSKENGVTKLSSIDVFTSYDKAKEFVDDNVQGQIFIEHNCEVVEKYDCKVNCHEAEPFISGLLIDKVLYYVATTSGNTIVGFKYTNFTTERLIVRQKIEG